LGQALSILPGFFRFSRGVSLLSRAGFLTENQAMVFRQSLFAFRTCGEPPVVQMMAPGVRNEATPFWGEIDSIFITARKPFRPASSWTLGRWIMAVVIGAHTKN